jgi:ABC-type transport system involved in multi-copper enzyme maturation permease subunit
MKKIFIALSVGIIMLSYIGCSTVMHSTTQSIELKTNPPNAKITIDGKKFGTTPQTVNIDRGINHIIKFELDGYETYETQATRKVSNWFWLNVFNGLLPGMVIDMFTGSMYNILPENIDVELTSAKVVEDKKKK